MCSALTDWQKIEAVNIFVLSGLEYHLNASIPDRSWLARLDATIRRRVKKPIALQNSIYKIYAAILAKRLACWCIDNRTISPMQKGFLPYEGCFEHSFLMSSLFEDSKCRCRELRVVWFDLRNAFGNVTHDLLFDMMNRLNIH